MLNISIRRQSKEGSEYWMQGNHSGAFALLYMMKIRLYFFHDAQTPLHRAQPYKGSKVDLSVNAIMIKQLVSQFAAQYPSKAR
jgi:hypothetical protein